MIRIRVVQGGHHLFRDCFRAPVVHVVRDVIEVEEPGTEVAAHPHLVIRCEGPACAEQF